MNVELVQIKPKKKYRASCDSAGCTVQQIEKSDGPKMHTEIVAAVC